MRLKLRIHRGRAHTKITFFFGVDLDHLQNSGQITIGTNQLNSFLQFIKPNSVVEYTEGL